MRCHKCRLWAATFSYQVENGTGYTEHYPAAAVRVNKSCLFSTTQFDIHSVCRFRHSCCQSRDELQHLLFPHPPEHFLPTFCLRFALDWWSIWPRYFSSVKHSMTSTFDSVYLRNNVLIILKSLIKMRRYKVSHSWSYIGQWRYRTTNSYPRN